MVAFNKVVEGDTYYDCRMQKQGNTTIRRMACWTVKIIEIDSVNVRALVSWNGNTPQWYSADRISKLRRTKSKRA